jgi:transposase-like protein
MNKKYPDEFKQKAVRQVVEIQSVTGSLHVQIGNHYHYKSNAS